MLVSGTVSTYPLSYPHISEPPSPSFSLDEPSEDLLTRHEDEAARLRSELASKHALLAKAQKWEAIVGEQRALAAAASDQSRLTGRGVRGDPGRLLREEKMRKRVEREKPKVRITLRGMLRRADFITTIYS